MDVESAGRIPHAAAVTMEGKDEWRWFFMSHGGHVNQGFACHPVDLPSLVRKGFSSFGLGNKAEQRGEKEGKTLFHRDSFKHRSPPLVGNHFTVFHSSETHASQAR